LYYYHRLHILYCPFHTKYSFLFIMFWLLAVPYFSVAAQAFVDKVLTTAYLWILYWFQILMKLYLFYQLFTTLTFTCTTFAKNKIKFFELPLCLIIFTVRLSAKAGHILFPVNNRNNPINRLKGETFRISE
jgi:hypothetical protein